MMDLKSHGLPAGLGEPFGQLEDAVHRLSRRVGEMSQEELDYTGPEGNVNSTAMLIRHMSYTDVGYLYAIKGEEVPPEVEARYGPYQTDDGTLPKVSGMPARELLERYQEVLDMIREHLRTQSEAGASRPVTIPWWSEPATVRYVLWHMTYHAAFHQGHIARLRAWYKHRSA